MTSDEYAQLFATHEDWFKTTTAKRQEVGTTPPRVLRELMYFRTGY